MIPEGQTALYDAISESLKYLQDGTRDKKVLIVISDGGDNASHQTLPAILRLVQASGALIYTIGIFEPNDPDSNPGVLRRLAHTSGGEAYFPAHLDEVVETCERIARDIRTQYTLCYVPGVAPQPGVFRAVHVTAHTPEDGRLHVRTRTGYIAEPVRRLTQVEASK